MSIKKSKYSVSAVINQKGNIIGYLSSRDEENGLDIELDLKGYTIMPLEALEEFSEIKETKNSKPMFTISENMVVVETTATWSNPLSSDRDMMKLFLENNRETLESYHNSEDNYGITFYACGYNGRAQDEFVQGWADNGVRVV